MNVKSTLQLFVLFLSLSFAGNLGAQPTASTSTTIYAYRIQSNRTNFTNGYIYATSGDGINTGNNTNDISAYWYFEPTGSTNQYYIRSLSTGKYMKAINSNTGNTTVIELVTNKENTNNFKFNISGTNNTAITTELNSGRGLNLYGGDAIGNGICFWDANDPGSKWNLTNNTSLTVATFDEPSVTMSGLAGGVNPYGIQLSTTFTNSSWNAPTAAIGGNNYCYVNGQLKAASGTKTTTNTWTIVEGGTYALIDNNGVLQSNAENSLTTPQTVTVRLHTVCKIGTTTVSEFNTDYNITLVFHPAVNEDAFEGVAVSPSSATIDEGESVEFSAPLTGVLSSRTCPLYIEFAGENQ